MATLSPHAMSQDIRSIDDVLAHFDELEHRLPLVQLDGLRYFHQTYRIITRRVRQALQKGVFENPDFLSQFDARFAQYYLEAIWNFLHNKPTCAAWHTAFMVGTMTHKPLASLALGVNAHINHDIPFVLRDMQADRVHHKDYKRVNAIISQSIKEVLGELRKTSRYGWLYIRIYPLYWFCMQTLVVWWRGKAWRLHNSVAKDSTGSRAVQIRSKRLAKLLSCIPI